MLFRPSNYTLSLNFANFDPLLERALVAQWIARLPLDLTIGVRDTAEPSNLFEFFGT